MDNKDFERRKRAWEFAHKLITLGKVAPEREGKDLLDVRTEEICKAMGRPQGASLEEVQQFDSPKSTNDS